MCSMIDINYEFTNSITKRKKNSFCTHEKMFRKDNLPSLCRNQWLQTRNTHHKLDFSVNHISCINSDMQKASSKSIPKKIQKHFKNYIFSIDRHRKQSGIRRRVVRRLISFTYVDKLCKVVIFPLHCLKWEELLLRTKWLEDQLIPNWRGADDQNTDESGMIAPNTVRYFQASFWIRIEQQLRGSAK